MTKDDELESEFWGSVSEHDGLGDRLGQTLLGSPDDEDTDDIPGLREDTREGLLTSFLERGPIGCLIGAAITGLVLVFGRRLLRRAYRNHPSARTRRA